jgi:hypothetical protein
MTRLPITLGALALLAACLPLAVAAPPVTASSQVAARIVVWRPHAGEQTQFEEGYRRHLGWHRAHADTWSWLGWTLISGDRPGLFVDGTFFHPWDDFDHPVDPAGDAADNQRNTQPHGDVVSAAAYELVANASDVAAERMRAPLMTFAFVAVAPEDGAAFESALASVASPAPHALLRPVNGADEYLLLLPATKQSELPVQAAFLRAAVRGTSTARARVLRVRTETGRYRAELGYQPGVR